MYNMYIHNVRPLARLFLDLEAKPLLRTLLGKFEENHRHVISHFSSFTLNFYFSTHHLPCHNFEEHATFPVKLLIYV